MWTPDKFKYELPKERIAQKPVEPRDHSKLLVVDRETGAVSDRHFYDLPDLLNAGDVLVRNNTKVLPARLFGKKSTGGACEVLLVRQLRMTASTCVWECMTKPGLKVGAEVMFGEELRAVCTAITGFTRELKFAVSGPEFFAAIDKIGHTPIPPYIDWEDQDEQHLREVYQTIFAKLVGSVAAPTAGLHFTPEVEQRLRDKGVQIEEVTLHVGLGTFLPLQPEQIETKTLHHEWYQVTDEVAERLNAAKAAGRKIIAVGTTTTRVLETSGASGQVVAGSGDTSLFIQPGFKFQIVQGMITNFHLPESSLLMLVSAFVSTPNTENEFRTFAESSIGRAYHHAIENEYRFFSFGDAMMV